MVYDKRRPVFTETFNKKAFLQSQDKLSHMMLSAYVYSEHSPNSVSKDVTKSFRAVNKNFEVKYDEE